MSDMPETIAIRNPHVRQLVMEELGRGVGRNATETAENLILEAVAHRALMRAQAETGKPRRRVPREPVSAA